MESKKNYCVSVFFEQLVMLLKSMWLTSDQIYGELRNRYEIDYALLKRDL